MRRDYGVLTRALVAGASFSAQVGKRVDDEVSLGAQVSFIVDVV